MITITTKQIKLVWVLARQIGMDSDCLHEMVFNVTGKDSLKALSNKESKQVIDSLVYAGAKVKKTRKPRRDLPPNVIELISPEQFRFIKYLERELGWHENPERLKGFLRRTIKSDVAKTKQDGIKAIQGLKTMVERTKSVRRENGKQRNNLRG